MMKRYQFWFVVGTQHLYGEDIFEIINSRAQEMAETISKALLPFSELEFKVLAKTSEEIYQVFKEANQNDDLAGIITWMHTFSPSKMWIKGLSILQKPLLHLHTQYHQDIPWNEINMDFMNLNQAAHGDREHGHIFTKMRKNRKVISGYFKDETVLARIAQWTQSAVGYMESHRINVIRFGDNMRNVAVTEGDKVDAQIKLGWSVQTYGVGDLVQAVNAVTPLELKTQMERYASRYDFDLKDIKAIEYQAKLQIGIDTFLRSKNGSAFTTTFEDLHGLDQLPGLSAQDLMGEGYGFAGEGDWKTAALLRVVKLMTNNDTQVASFMEDYTYHLEKNNELVLGAHMLEICPSIASGRPKIEVHPLGIGGKNNPARLTFDAKTGQALQISIIDLGDRFRMIIAECDAVKPLQNMPNLPVARAMWKLLPDFHTATEAWILAGGAHHTVMIYNADPIIFKDLADMLGIECIHIGAHTKISELQKELMFNDVIYGFKR